MARPTVEQTRDLLKKGDLKAFCREHLFPGLPHVFEPNPAHNERFINYMTMQLSIRPDQLTIVGSGKLGYSLDPQAFPRPFTKFSDIDVIVVSEVIFDKIWHALLDWHYPRYYGGLPASDGPWVQLRRKDIYFGMMVPHEIVTTGLSLPKMLIPIREQRSLWFNTFQNASTLPGLAGRTINSRLYRTWDYAEKYHVESLRQLAEKLI